MGHAGTLDPMATGVLVVGINKATRLLTYIVGTSKTYEATIRLGASTITDDAEGDITSTAFTDGVTDDAIEAGVTALRGPIEQVPSSVSAIKVNGERAYARVRSGEDVKLAARPVTIHSFDILAIRHGVVAPEPQQPQAEEAASAQLKHDDVTYIDVDVSVRCSSGTYIRALARDLGTGLGVGGHLTALRRSSVGPYNLAQARTLEELAEDLVVLDIADAARALMAVRELTAEEAVELSFGRRIPASPDGTHTVAEPAAAFAPDGTLVALLADAGKHAKPVLVFPPDPAPAPNSTAPNSTAPNSTAPNKPSDTKEPLK